MAQSWEGSLVKNISSSMHATPNVIAVSAILNAGKCEQAQKKSRKSTTWPSASRSHKLPNAPPSTNAKPACTHLDSFLVSNQPIIKALATQTTAVKNQRCQPPAPA